jgi:hypothetical protein
MVVTSPSAPDSAGAPAGVAAPSLGAAGTPVQALKTRSTAKLAITIEQKRYMLFFLHYFIYTLYETDIQSTAEN